MSIPWRRKIQSVLPGQPRLRMLCCLPGLLMRSLPGALMNSRYFFKSHLKETKKNEVFLVSILPVLSITSLIEIEVFQYLSIPFKQIAEKKMEFSIPSLCTRINFDFSQCLVKLNMIIATNKERGGHLWWVGSNHCGCS